ncbi:MAG: type II toxin-antitoxin system HicA family toxin, partial [Candidatus Hydrogenedens sp.]|nr:type II toxin-antitoxin system HicA family toxin [Candidatus Hydrogenedens sp.]
RRMSGREVLDVFRSLGFEVVSQKGSHVKLRRTGPNGEQQTLTVPNHTELDTGTLRAIIRQATRHVTMDEIQRHFYR